MDNGRLPAAFEHGSNAAEVEHRFCGWKEFTSRTECSQQPSAVSGAAAGESGKERGVRMLGKGASDLAIVATDGGVDGAQPESERLHGDDGTLPMGFAQSANPFFYCV